MFTYWSMFSWMQSDVFLICSNAMQYNAPDTIYHKQVQDFDRFFFSDCICSVFFCFLVL